MSTYRMEQRVSEAVVLSDTELANLAHSLIMLEKEDFPHRQLTRMRLMLGRLSFEVEERQSDGDVR